MTNADIDYLESELHKITSRAPKTWPPPSSSAHYYNIYSRLESLRAPAPPPPPPPAPTGVVDFDGRAVKFSELTTAGIGDYGVATDTFKQIQTLIDPKDGDLWTALAFRPGVIKLESNTRYGQVTHAYGRTGIINPWNGSNPDTAAGQTSTRQPCNVGKTRFYSVAVKIDHWNGPIGDLFFCDAASFGYQTSSNDQVVIALGRGPGDTALTWAVAVNGGETGQNGASIQQGNAPGTTNFKDWLKPVTFGQWEEYIYEIGWSASTKNGHVRIYNRSCPNDVPGNWNQIYEKDAIDTLLWGDIRLGDGTIQHFDQNPDPASTIIDKVGIYFKEYGGEAEDYSYTGLHICDNLDLAKASFPQ